MCAYDNTRLRTTTIQTKMTGKPEDLESRIILAHFVFRKTEHANLCGYNNTRLRTTRPMREFSQSTECKQIYFLSEKHRHLVKKSLQTRAASSGSKITATRSRNSPSRRSRSEASPSPGQGI
jgi:hypothetical protein